jgi:predicted CoA-binding protein
MKAALALAGQFSARVRRRAGRESMVNHESYSDDYLRGILARVKTIAMAGASERQDRPSHIVMKYLHSKGYRVIPVNPAAKAAEILGEKVYKCVEDIPFPVDMVDVFRRSEEAPTLVEAAIRKGAKVVWMQLGVRNDAAAKTAEDAGLAVVMNRCPKIERSRLYGDLGRDGANAEVIPAKRRKPG